jgi:hypothetical protein
VERKEIVPGRSLGTENEFTRCLLAIPTEVGIVSLLPPLNGGGDSLEPPLRGWTPPASLSVNSPPRLTEPYLRVPHFSRNWLKP